MDSLILSGENAFFTLIKIGVIIFLFLYVLFAAIVIKQVRMMTETLEVGVEFHVKFIVFLHLIAAVATLILAFLII